VLKMAKSLTSLASMIECGICLDTLVEPMVMPCQHNFCKKCIQQWIDTNSDEGKINCPFCKDVCLVGDIKKSFLMNEVIEREQMRSKLYDEITSRYGICEKHEQPMKFFCDSCNTAVCVECGFATHRSHFVNEIEKKTAMKEYLSLMRSNSEKLRLGVDELVISLGNLENTKLMVKENILKASKELSSKIKEREDKLCLELEDLILTYKKNLETQKTDFEKQLAKVEMICKKGDKSGQVITDELLDEIKHCAE
jgi:hypothetical protein